MSFALRFVEKTFAVSAAVVVLAACSPAATMGTAEKPTVPGGTVTVRLTGDWVHLDPQNPSNPGNMSSETIKRALYDTLIAVGPDGNLVPYLAKSWKQTPTSIEFTMRNDATCSDGTKLTATAIKNSFERGVKHVSAAPNLGPGPYSLAADDATDTFTWSTQTPESDAIYYFARYAAIVCPAGLANPSALLTTAQGSGPYVLEDAVQGDHLTVKLRPDWNWGPLGLTAKSPGLPERIIFKVVTNETTAANLLLTGGLDIGQVSGPDVDRLLANKDLTNKTAIAPIDFVLTFNHSPDRPTADPKVREALASAIDPNTWNHIVYEDRGFVSPSFLTPRADCYDASVTQYLPTDPGPERTKQILIAAGWTLVNGKFEKGGKPLVINLVSTTEGFGSGPEYLDATWENAGITVKFDLLDAATFIQRHIQGDFDADVQVNSSETASPLAGAALLLGAAPPVGINFSRSVNPEAEEEFALARSTQGAERCQHWSNVQRLLLQSYDILPLAAPAIQWFSRNLDFAPGVTVNVRYIRRVK